VLDSFHVSKSIAQALMGSSFLLINSHFLKLIPYIVMTWSMAHAGRICHGANHVRPQDLHGNLQM
jgi:hypothetical protein